MCDLSGMLMFVTKMHLLLVKWRLLSVPLLGTMSLTQRRYSEADLLMSSDECSEDKSRHVLRKAVMRFW